MRATPIFPFLISRLRFVFDGTTFDGMHCSTVSGPVWASLGGVCCRLGDDSDAIEILQMRRIDHLSNTFMETDMRMGKKPPATVTFGGF